MKGKKEIKIKIFHTQLRSFRNDGIPCNCVSIKIIQNELVDFVWICDGRGRCWCLRSECFVPVFDIITVSHNNVCRRKKNMVFLRLTFDGSEQLERKVAWAHSYEQTNQKWFCKKLAANDRFDKSDHNFNSKHWRRRWQSTLSVQIYFHLMSSRFYCTFNWDEEKNGSHLRKWEHKARNVEVGERRPNRRWWRRRSW